MDPGELLERAQLPRRILPATLDRVGDLRDVEIASRVRGKTVGRDELPRPFAREAIPDPANQLSLDRKDAHAVAEVGDGSVHLEPGPQLTDQEEPAVLVVVAEPAGAVEIVPLAEVLPLRVEDLDPVILPVSHVDETLGVRDDVVRKVEAAGVSAGPAQEKRCRPFGSYLWTREFP